MKKRSDDSLATSHQPLTTGLTRGPRTFQTGEDTEPETEERCGQIYAVMKSDVPKERGAWPLEAEAGGSVSKEVLDYSIPTTHQWDLRDLPSLKTLA